jgi:hypothetical protein
MAGGKNTPPGPGVDASGQTVTDPTANVLDLVEAAIKRQDDLRDLSSAHLREVMTLRSEYERQLRIAETARIDAIRAVDVAAVQRAAEVAAEAVQTLAAQVPITAEAVRTSLAAALNPILNDIAELRKVQYEQQGQKAASVDARSDRYDARNLVIAIGALLVLVATFIAPHIH